MTDENACRPWSTLAVQMLAHESKGVQGRTSEHFVRLELVLRYRSALVGV